MSLHQLLPNALCRSSSLKAGSEFASRCKIGVPSDLLVLFDFCCLINFAFCFSKLWPLRCAGNCLTIKLLWLCYSLGVRRHNNTGHLETNLPVSFHFHYSQPWTIFLSLLIHKCLCHHNRNHVHMQNILVFDI